MITKKNLFKTTIAFTLGLFLIFFASFGLVDILTIKDVHATGDGNAIAVSISNSKFDSYSSSTGQPNSFTRYINGQKYDDSTATAVEAKIIDITSSTYSGKYKTTFPENYKKVLMISGEGLNNVDFGYVTNSSIKLAENSYYRITADVFTADDDGIGSITLQTENDEFASINNINSYKGWSTYSFLIATKDAVDVSLGLYLRGEGTILFDNLSCYKINKTVLNSLKETYSNNETLKNKYNYIDKTEQPLSEYHFADNQIVNSNDNSDTYSLVSSGDIQAEVIPDSDGKHSHALHIVASDAQAYVSNASGKDLLTFKKNNIYKVTVIAKVTSVTEDAYLRLVQTNSENYQFKENDDERDSEYLTITSATTTSENVDYDYKPYSFYIYSDPLEDKTYELHFGFGSTKNASGEMYISCIEISHANYSTYNSASTNSKLDLVTDNTYSSSPVAVDNGNFNAIEISDYASPMPAKPTKWTSSETNNNQIHGVVSVDTNSFAEVKNLISSASNPFGSQGKDYENVLMMYNAGADTISYTSATKELSAREYHRFSIDVLTQNSKVKLALVAKIDDDYVELASLNVVATNDIWNTYNLCLYTGYQKLNVAVRVTMETENSGFAYVDNAYFYGYYTQNTLETNFKDAKSNNYALAVDLSNLVGTSQNSQWAENNMFKAGEETYIKQGVIDMNGDNLATQVFPNDSYLQSFTDIDADYSFGLRASQYTNYTTKSNIGFDLKSNNYYKIVISVYSMIEGKNSQSGVASIKLSSFDDYFAYINTNNQWQTYTFYVSPNEDTTSYFELSIGNPQTLTQGSIFFANIKFFDSSVDEDKDVISEEIFKSVSTQDKTMVLNTVTVKEDENTDSSNESTNNTENNSSAWWYAVPSIIFALTIVLCIVVVVLRKVKWKKPFKKNTQTSYDRDKTVSMQVYTRRATAIRESKIHELKNDLKVLTEERNKLETEYKQAMAKLRELKIKRGDAGEIAKLERDVHKIQKTTSASGISVNKLEKELEYVKTDLYFKSLIRKLSREGLVEKDANTAKENKD